MILIRIILTLLLVYMRMPRGGNSGVKTLTRREYLRFTDADKRTREWSYDDWFAGLSGMQISTVPPQSLFRCHNKHLLANS